MDGGGRDANGGEVIAWSGNGAVVVTTVSLVGMVSMVMANVPQLC